MHRNDDEPARTMVLVHRIVWKNVWKLKLGLKILQTDIDGFVQDVVMLQINAFKIVETTGVWEGKKEDSSTLLSYTKIFRKCCQ
jgi:hypothetical protein